MNILNKIKLVGLIAVLAFGPFIARDATAQPGVSVPVQTFYNELAPYGQWLPSPNYGSVWVPNVGPDFQPYATDGHWIVTEFGNTWVSDYPWGWAPFHYGRWYFDNQYGWAWVPDSDWGPAWVSWRSGGGYYGWAPLGPGFNINVNINIPAPYWTFVPQIYITSPRLYSYCVPRPNVVNIYQNTTYINNIYRSNNRSYVYGPPRGDIERITRRSVPVYRIDAMDRPGRSVVGNGSVGFYRPGQSSGYGQNNGRNDRFDNPPRSGYTGNSASNRGNYGGGYNSPNRDYNGNNSPNRDYNNNGSGAPNRNYDGNNSPSRGNYGGNNPTDRGGNSGNNVAPVTPQPNRFEPSRGSFSPGNSPQSSNVPGNMPSVDNSSRGGQRGNFSPGMPQANGSSPQPNRSFDRGAQQGSINSQPIQGGRSDGGNIQRMPENRGGQIQQHSPQPQQSNGGGERQGRGPR
jgi:hypothetical protein